MPRRLLACFLVGAVAQAAELEIQIQQSGSLGRHLTNNDAVPLAPSVVQDAAVATALFAALKIARSPAAAPATAAFVAGRLYGWVSSQWTEGAGALNALFLFADVFNRRGLQQYSDESDTQFLAHLAERREHFAMLARTAVPREEVARTLTLKFQSRDKSSMVKIQVFVPFPSPQRDTKLPLIVYYHGGGFVILSALAYENHSRRMANAVGAIVASVDYRLAPEHKYPAAHDDALDGLRKAVEWCEADDRCDATRIAVAGDSAGGHLAAATALDADGIALKAQALLGPIVAPYVSLPSHLRRVNDPILGRGLMDWFWSRYLADAARETCDPRLYLPRRERANWEAVPPAIVVTSAQIKFCGPIRTPGTRLTG